MYPIIPEKLRQIGATDLMGPLPRTQKGNVFIFVVLELTSKYVTLTPLKKATGRSISKALTQDFLRQVGHVDKLLSDNGPQYRSAQWRDTLRRHKIKPVFISKYMPSANPAERTMKDLGALCRLYCNKQHNTWDKHLAEFQNVVNEMPHSSTLLPPITVLKNKPAPDKIREIIKFPPVPRIRHQQLVKLALCNLKAAALKRKTRADKTATTRVFFQGQRVLVKTFHLSNKKKHQSHKFFSVYKGPMEIRKIVHDNAVELVNPKTGKSLGLHHVSHLKAYKD